MKMLNWFILEELKRGTKPIEIRQFFPETTLRRIHRIRAHHKVPPFKRGRVLGYSPPSYRMKSIKGLCEIMMVAKIRKKLGISSAYVAQCRDTEKAKARKMVHCAIKNGELERPSKCSHCGGRKTRIEAHHSDYSKPLEVEWLCQHCHRSLKHPNNFLK